MGNGLEMKGVELFRTGTHTDSKGGRHTITEADLDHIVRSFAAQPHQAPAVVGHPDDTAPAFGWLANVRRAGDRLVGDFKDVVPAFAENIKNRIYPNRSISLRSDGTIRHVGWLGGVAPAVPGLAPVSFSSAEDAVSYEFSDGTPLGLISSIGALMRNIREYIVGEKGVDAADRVIPNYQIDELTNAPDQMEQAQPDAMGFSEKPHKEGNVTEAEAAELQRQNDELKGQVASFSEGEKKRDDELKTLRDEKAALARAASRKDDLAFCEKLTGEGRLAPAIVPTVLDFMGIVGTVETFDFAEGDGKKAASPREKFRELLSKSGKVLDFSEIATGGDACTDTTDAPSMAAKAREFKESEKAAGRTITITDAVDHIKKQGGK